MRQDVWHCNFLLPHPLISTVACLFCCRRLALGAACLGLSLSTSLPKPTSAFVVAAGSPSGSDGNARQLAAQQIAARQPRPLEQAPRARQVGWPASHFGAVAS